MGGGRGRQAKSLLIVDDEPLILSMLAQVLERRGFRAVQAGSVDAALAIVRARPDEIGAVLSDLRMPGRTGADLVQELASTRPEIPIALMSSGFDGELMSRLPTVREWFVKPVDSDVLAGRLAALMAPSPRARQARHGGHSAHARH